MSEKPQIEKLRVFHDLQNQFEVPDAIAHELKSQLPPGDRAVIERFVSGFKIEDWFEWIFSTLPWVRLIHGLDQQQFPKLSKESYQVPDFLLLVEVSTLEHLPLLAEVKRVAKGKKSLNLPDSQMALCEKYAAQLQIPLVYAIYWEEFSGWTLNTPDAFERKSSRRKLSMLSAFELDCGTILGDLSHLVSSELVRVSRFSTQDITPESVRHEKHGRLVADVVSLGNCKVEMNCLESAVIDSMLTMTSVKDEDVGNGETEVTEMPGDIYVPKLSSWITRHLALLQTEPSEKHANVSANVIVDLMKKLECPVLHLFPSGRSKDLDRLDELFRKSR